MHRSGSNPIREAKRRIGSVVNENVDIEIIMGRLVDIWEDLGEQLDRIESSMTAINDKIELMLRTQAGRR